MKKSILILSIVLMVGHQLRAQTEPSAGNWKTWFITSGKDYRLAAPVSHKQEVAEVMAKQKALDTEGLQQIVYWNAGAPGYRWQDMIRTLWMNDRGRNGALANMLVGVATYDATIAAWDTKYAFKTARPFEEDSRIKLFGPNPSSPSYPCEHSVAAGVAATIISHYYPQMTDSVNGMVKQLMDSRVAAGLAFPSDTRAGYELGKRIAEKELEHTRDFVSKEEWDGKLPKQSGTWKGKPSQPMAGHNKTVVLTSSSQFRPGPPPDFAKEMEELRNFKPTFSSMANAFFFASESFWDELLNKKIFEYNLHLNPPRAARIYAISGIGMYDGFTSCWDAKYTYWGIRPDQYDTSFHPVLFFTPPFPGYPSGHAMLGSVMAELYSYFFPVDKNYFIKRARDGAESRFQGGIHFRTDNETGLEMGKKVGAAIIEKARMDGADKTPGL